MKCTKLSISLLFLLISFFSAGQNDTNPAGNTFTEVNSGYGFILAHRKSMKYLLHHVPSVDIKIGKSTAGKELWEQLYKYPEYGIGGYWANLGDPDLLGSVFATYAYMNYPIIRNQKFRFSYMYGAGMSYVSRCFDVQDNYTNIAIGSKINIIFNIKFNTSINLTERLALTNNFGMTHYSNGAWAKPNLGINVCDMYVGLRYYTDKKNTDGIIKHDIPEFKRINNIVVFYYSGIKAIDPPAGPRYIFSTISVNLNRELNHKRTIGCGTDFFYDESLYTEFADTSDTKFIHVIRNGIFLSHEYKIKRLSLLTQLGAYTYTKVTPVFILYTRTGFRYNITKRIIANLSLKAHFAIAEYVEWGIGYRF